MNNNPKSLLYYERGLSTDAVRQRAKDIQEGLYSALKSESFVPVLGLRWYVDAQLACLQITDRETRLLVTYRLENLRVMLRDFWKAQHVEDTKRAEESDWGLVLCDAMGHRMAARGIK